MCGIDYLADTTVAYALYNIVGCTVVAREREGVILPILEVVELICVRVLRSQAGVTERYVCGERYLS